MWKEVIAVPRLTNLFTCNCIEPATLLSSWLLLHFEWLESEDVTLEAFDLNIPVVRLVFFQPDCYVEWWLLYNQTLRSFDRLTRFLILGFRTQAPQTTNVTLSTPDVIKSFHLWPLLLESAGHPKQIQQRQHIEVSRPVFVVVRSRLTRQKSTTTHNRRRCRGGLRLSP